MTQYRYFLEPWGWRDHLAGGRSSNKYMCPNCGKRTFVRYVDGETGAYLGDHVGKCDREDKCGYHYSPAMFFQDHPDETSQLQVLQVCEDYFLGGDGDGGTIYWQVDELGRPRSGKIIQYDRQTGCRIKDTSLPVSWVHKKLIKAGQLPNNWKLSQCLFGAHLLPKRTDAPVCLVESEKTALICSIRLPSCLWIATGGLNNFRLCVLAEKFSAKIGFRCKVSRLLEEKATEQERQNGLDLADYLLRSG